jgi:alkyl sulfatase BDS1-like metallo-beta-lactamase superfamily hydrolase
MKPSMSARSGWRAAASHVHERGPYRFGKEAEVMFASHHRPRWEQNDSRGVIQRFLGHWDGNPSDLLPLSPEDPVPLYVDIRAAPPWSAP